MRIFIVMAFLLVSLCALGQEAPPTPEATGVDWVGTLVNGAVLLIPMLLTAGFAWLVKKVATNETKEKALQIVQSAVTATYDTYVREIKAGRADGKLTDAEKKEAMRRTLETVYSEGTPAVKAVYEAWGKPYVKHLVERVISKFKKKE